MCIRDRRVAVGERVATVYTDSAAMKTEDQLDTLRAQLDQLTYAMGESESPTAGVKLDSSIQSAIFAMQKNLHTRQYTALEGSVSELRSLVIRRDYSSGGESTAELEAQAEALRAQIKKMCIRDRSMAELTPMMQQYVKLKEANPGALLFFRLGDFYEMFGEDAKTASRELDLTLTTRDRGKDKADQTPMCGVPYHSCLLYTSRCA